MKFIKGLFKTALIGVGLLAVVAAGLIWVGSSRFFSDPGVRTELAESERVQGKHCERYEDGRTPPRHALIVWLKSEYLRYPDTFERIETGMGPKEEDGTHFVYVKFRAKNALGVPIPPHGFRTREPRHVHARPFVDHGLRGLSEFRRPGRSAGPSSTRTDTTSPGRWTRSAPATLSTRVAKVRSPRRSLAPSSPRASRTRSETGFRSEGMETFARDLRGRAQKRCTGSRHMSSTSRGFNRTSFRRLANSSTSCRRCTPTEAQLQQLVFVTVAVVLQPRARHRLPHHGRGPTMLGEHRQHQRIVPVASETRPIQCRHDLLSRTDHMGYPMRKEVVHFDGGIAQQPVDLLDAVFAQRSTGVGQSLSNRVDSQGGTGEDSERTVGERHDPLGVQIAVVEIVDERNQMVFAKDGSGFHYPLSEAKECIEMVFA